MKNPSAKAQMVLAAPKKIAVIGRIFRKPVESITYVDPPGASDPFATVLPTGADAEVTG